MLEPASTISTRRTRPSAVSLEATGLESQEIENGVVQKGDWGGFSGPIFTDSGGAILFNLYTNPKEDVSVGVRHIPMLIPVMQAAAFYMQELIKYPPQFKIGFLSNNPPVYNLLPKARELLEKRGVGKAAP
jgi:hypothetical protein